MQFSLHAALLWLMLLATGMAYSLKSGSVSVNADKSFDIVPGSAQRVSLESVRDKVALSVFLQGASSRPHQLNFVFTNGEGLDYAVFPLFDESTGKVSALTLVNKIPASLLSLERVFVYAVAADASQKKSQNLNTLVAELIPSEALRASLNYEEPVRLGALPEIHHIFREDPKTVNPIVPIFFSAVAIALLFVLVGSWFGLVGNSLFAARQGIPYKGGFLTTIALFEYTFFRYYLSASIFTTIFYVAVLAGPAILFGSKALKALTKQRTVIEAST